MLHSCYWDTAWPAQLLIHWVFFRWKKFLSDCLFVKGKRYWLQWELCLTKSWINVGFISVSACIRWLGVILSQQLLKTALLKPWSFPLRSDEISVIQQLILLPQHFLTSALYILAVVIRLFQNSPSEHKRVLSTRPDLTPAGSQQNITTSAVSLDCCYGIRGQKMIQTHLQKV